jgi:hypothetical protein
MKLKDCNKFSPFFFNHTKYLLQYDIGSIVVSTESIYFTHHITILSSSASSSPISIVISASTFHSVILQQNTVQLIKATVAATSGGSH